LSVSTDGRAVGVSTCAIAANGISDGATGATLSKSAAGIATVRFTTGRRAAPDIARSITAVAGCRCTGGAIGTSTIAAVSIRTTANAFSAHAAFAAFATVAGNDHARFAHRARAARSRRAHNEIGSNVDGCALGTATSATNGVTGGSGSALATLAANAT
jgi:hypothetical protein